eukprot:6191127-Pleurochrysis_carterae.AAC.1
MHTPVKCAGQACRTYMHPKQCPGCKIAYGLQLWMISWVRRKIENNTGDALGQRLSQRRVTSYSVRKEAECDALPLHLPPPPRFARLHARTLSLPSCPPVHSHASLPCCPPACQPASLPAFQPARLPA